MACPSQRRARKASSLKWGPRNFGMQPTASGRGRYRRSADKRTRETLLIQPTLLTVVALLFLFAGEASSQAMALGSGLEVENHQIVDVVVEDLEQGGRRHRAHC